MGRPPCPRFRPSQRRGSGPRTRGADRRRRRPGAAGAAVAPQEGKRRRPLGPVGRRWPTPRKERRVSVHLRPPLVMLSDRPGLLLCRSQCSLTEGLLRETSSSKGNSNRPRWNTLQHAAGRLNGVPLSAQKHSHFHSGFCLNISEIIERKCLRFQRPSETDAPGLE